LIVQVLSLTIALAAVIVGPVVSLRIARAEIRATVLSANRQAWINILRDELSGYVAAVSEAALYLADSHPNDYEVGRLLMKEVTKHRLRVLLLLNPAEEEHELLLGHVTSLMDAATVTGCDIDALVDPLVRQSRVVLKSEWNRAKALE
jgi:hypothetical protein